MIPQVERDDVEAETPQGLRVLHHIAGTVRVEEPVHDDHDRGAGCAGRMVTGEDRPFKFSRSYGCGQISSSKNLMLFRSASLGYFDLTRKAGVEDYGGIRLGCWINAIPAGGVLLMPESSSGCTCKYAIQTSMGFMNHQQ